VVDQLRTSLPAFVDTGKRVVKRGTPHPHKRGCDDRLGVGQGEVDLMMRILLLGHDEVSRQPDRIEVRCTLRQGSLIKLLYRRSLGHARLVERDEYADVVESAVLYVEPVTKIAGSVRDSAGSNRRSGDPWVRYSIGPPRATSSTSRCSRNDSQRTRFSPFALAVDAGFDRAVFAEMVANIDRFRTSTSTSAVCG
jgi:hypothetical protein